MAQDLKPHITWIRQQYPALQRAVNGHPAAYFDGPGGTQTPQVVIDAVANYLANTNANHEGLFVTSRESDALLHEAHAAVADLLGADDPQTIVFGANMTSLTFAISRSLARTWSLGDEIIVTRLDHDANFSPWVLAARDAGADVRIVDIHREDCTLNLDDLREKISPRTRLVAVGCASNAVGSVNPVKQIAEWAHEVGALVFLDAVHWAPHARIDVNDLQCDLLGCSAYKFFGPHVGMLWAKEDLLRELEAYKVRPAPDDPPGKWMTGTQNHEGIAGVLAAIDYLATIGRRLADQNDLSRAGALDVAFKSILDYERELTLELLSGLAERPQYTVWGINDPTRINERAPTVAITHAKRTAAEVADQLGQKGHFVWHGNYYALNLTEALDLEPEGMVRIGLIHYNTSEEVQRLLSDLDEIA